MAAADRFFVEVTGRGGHAALPHLTTDPVVAAAAIVGALQPLVSRETSPTDAAVVSVSRFNTGAHFSAGYFMFFVLKVYELCLQGA